MGFVWSPLPKVADGLTSSSIKELQNNINQLCDDISISRPTWPSRSVGVEVIGGIETQIDRVDGENYCRTEKTTHYDTRNSGENTSYCSAVLSTEYSTAVSSYNGSQYSPFCGSDLNGYCPSQLADLYLYT